MLPQETFPDYFDILHGLQPLSETLSSSPGESREVRQWVLLNRKTSGASLGLEASRYPLDWLRDPQGYMAK